VKNRCRQAKCSLFGSAQKKQPKQHEDEYRNGGVLILLSPRHGGAGPTAHGTHGPEFINSDRGGGSDIVSVVKVWGVEFWPRPELSLDKTKITWVPGLGVCAAIATLWLGILAVAIFRLLEAHAGKKNLTNIAVFAGVLLFVVGAAFVKLVNRLYEWQ
jgi:hypothetical protein